MSRFSIGIDLGTTHSALSYLDLDASDQKGTLPIPQLTGPGTIEQKLLLPSFLYLASPEEFPPGSLNLPWDASSAATHRPVTQVVGEFARTHGAKVPTRLVSSAKSWLCHPGVDRREPILPWQATEAIDKVSPLEASARYLRHLKQAWNSQFEDLRQQEVVLTVPASFDAAARDLTLEAAQQAGLPQVVLLEEPQAALYAWIEAVGKDFRKRVSVGDVLLVIDVGGGTTDLSLIQVTDENGELGLQRLAVGDHILLGGDNMDLSVAHFVSQRWMKEGRKIDAWQFSVLTQASRQAKELLLSDDSLQSVPITLAARGSSLTAGTLRTELHRDDLSRLLLDGFFPVTHASEMPLTSRRSGLAQIGLPYAQDAAVTRHLAFFLSRQANAVPSPASFAAPTAVLFNGGVFKSAAIRSRVLETLNQWLAEAGLASARDLSVDADLDLAVARGAAYYGWVRQGHGLRIRGGTARAYYIGIETAMPAIPGVVPALKGLCVAPFGMEEGTQAEMPSQQFGLVVGEPTRFRFFTSSVRRQDKAGDEVDDAGHDPDLEEIAPIETQLGEKHPTGESQFEDQRVPIKLQAAVTETGLLELKCLETNGTRQWKLELNVRD